MAKLIGERILCRVVAGATAWRCCHAAGAPGLRVRGNNAAHAALDSDQRGAATQRAFTARRTSRSYFASSPTAAWARSMASFICRRRARERLAPGGDVRQRGGVRGGAPVAHGRAGEELVASG